ncbi:hypothetical protein AAEP93_003821 [Penicillium crustosum]
MSRTVHLFKLPKSSSTGRSSLSEVWSGDMPFMAFSIHRCARHLVRLRKLRPHPDCRAVSMKTKGIGIGSTPTPPMSDPAPPTPSALSIYCVNNGDAAAQADCRTVFAATADAAYIRKAPLPASLIEDQQPPPASLESTPIVQ